MNTRTGFSSLKIKSLLILFLLLSSLLINAQSAEEWYASAQQRIDTLRKGTFGLIISDRNGQPYSGDISVRLQKHEYPFGIAFDLYEGAVNNGNVYTTTATVNAPEDAEIYQSERWYSFIAYALPVEKDRTYRLTLKFAEIYFNTAGSRLFDVFIEGTRVLSDFDVFASAGGKNIAIDTAVTLLASDSYINIEMVSSVDNAAVKGIILETIEGDPVTLINCGGGALVTLDGHNYVSDAGYFDQSAPRFPTEEQWMKATMQKYFNYGVSGNSFKWSGIQPQHTAPNYTAFDNAVNWTKSIGWELRAHTLLWGGYNYEDDHALPRWVKDLPTPQAITDTCKMRVVREVSHYKGVVREYDVMNEPLHATYLSSVVGDSVNWNCFKWARSADPDAELFVNDYNVEYYWGDATKYRDHILKLKSMGAPVTGAGMQAHFWEGMRPNVSELVSRVNIVAEAGLPIKFTEFDNGVLSEEDQAEDIIKVATIAFSHPAMNGLILWALSDRGAWRDQSGIFYADHRPKLAADTLYYLTHELWSTRFDTTVTETDPFGFDAYFGDYTIEVNFNDTIKVFTIPCLQANEDSVFVLNETDAMVKGPQLNSLNLVNDSALVLVFDKPVQSESVARGDFKFFSDKPMRIQNIVRAPLDENIVIITLQDLIAPDDFLLVSYFPGSLSSTDGGKAEAFGPEPVINLTTGLISASVINDGYNIEAVFNARLRNLSENLTSFSIRDKGEEVGVNDVNYYENDSSRVIFDLSTPLSADSRPTIRYTKGTLEASEGFACQSSSDIAVNNIWPELLSAAVNADGTQIDALFGTKLQNVPDNLSAFTISADNQPVEIAGISETGADSSIVTFDLGLTVIAGQSVTLSYEPGTIQGINGNSLSEISNADVENNSVVTGIDVFEEGQLVIFPNPAHSEIQIMWETGFTALTILSADGKALMERGYEATVQSVTLSLNLDPGIYLLRIGNVNNCRVQKLIME
jgi:GH35 family endo-1,4-beta-xylanase